MPRRTSFFNVLLATVIVALVIAWFVSKGNEEFRKWKRDLESGAPRPVEVRVVR